MSIYLNLYNENIQFAASENIYKKSKAYVRNETIAIMENENTDIDSESREKYLSKITAKLKSGKRLKPQELEFLRKYYPYMYHTAMRVENARSALQNQLKSCRSKEAVNHVVSGQLQMLKAMKNDPDYEYMAAMVSREVDEFRKSSGYAKLPNTEKEAENAKKNLKKYWFSDGLKGDQDRILEIFDIFSKAYSQCGRLDFLCSQE